MNNLNGDERDHGLPKAPVSLRNPTAGAEIARLRHLTLACKPFFMGIASKRAETSWANSSSVNS